MKTSQGEILPDEIEECNKMIAVFMGAKLKEDEYFSRRTIIYHKKHFGLHTYIPEKLEYHKSWDWIMPVVEKTELYDYSFKMCRKVVELYQDSTKEVLARAKEDCRLTSLYVVVVFFIYSIHLKLEA